MKPTDKTVVQNRRGRPPTGQDPVSAIRLPHNLTAAIDYWAAHNGATSRSEAIRRLVEIGRGITAIAATKLQSCVEGPGFSSPANRQANRPIDTR